MMRARSVASLAAAVLTVALLPASSVGQPPQGLMPLCT